MSVTSGITLLEGARGQGMAGCPITKHLRKVQKFEACNAHELCSMEYRGRLKGPGGVQGQSPCWGYRGRSPQKLLCFSMQEQHFQHKLIAFDESERTSWAYRPLLLHVRDVWPGPPQNPNPFSGKRGPTFERFC